MTCTAMPRSQACMWPHGVVKSVARTTLFAIECSPETRGHKVTDGGSTDAPHHERQVTEQVTKSTRGRYRRGDAHLAGHCGEYGHTQLHAGQPRRMDRRCAGWRDADRRRIPSAA